MQIVNPKSRVALHLDNSELWLKLDKLLTKDQAIIIPIPHFFTQQQIQFMVKKAGVDSVVCHPQAEDLWLAMGFSFSSRLCDGVVLMEKFMTDYPKLPQNTHKITFTSGTTGEPKGVCLSLSHLQKVGKSLADITQKFGVKKHLCVLPLSVLLENMAAHYAAQHRDIEVITPSLTELGLSGFSSLDIKKLIASLVKYQPDSLILMPQMLKAIVYACEHHQVKLPFLKFIAVGGAVCSKGLLHKAQKLGLPVYEGYGISECGSVISLNTDRQSAGSVGQVLPHQQVEITEDDEIIVKGNLFLGYLGQKDNHEEHFHTGDLGRFDENNNLRIIGRKKNIIINSFGRNISPDWIEAELLAHDEISQVVVYGEAQPFLTALCVSQSDEKKIKAAIIKTNKTLPDYAQVKEIIHCEQAFSLKNGMLTASGKTKNPNIFNHYKKQLENVYANT